MRSSGIDEVVAEIVRCSEPPDKSAPSTNRQAVPNSSVKDRSTADAALLLVQRPCRCAPTLDGLDPRRLPARVAVRGLTTASASSLPSNVMSVPAREVAHSSTRRRTRARRPDPSARRAHMKVRILPGAKAPPGRTGASQWTNAAPADRNSSRSARRSATTSRASASTSVGQMSERLFF